MTNFWPIFGGAGVKNIRDTYDTIWNFGLSREVKELINCHYKGTGLSYDMLF